MLDKEIEGAVKIREGGEKPRSNSTIIKEQGSELKKKLSTKVNGKVVKQISVEFYKVYNCADVDSGRLNQCHVVIKP